MERVRPARVVLDSVTGLRLLAQTPARYRKQVLTLKRALARHGGTALLLDDLSQQTRDLQLRSLVHGIVSLERVADRQKDVFLATLAHELRNPLTAN